MAKNEPDNGVWVGLKTCGCCVAVVVDNSEPAMKKHVNATKREFLKDGLSVMHASWADWLAIYRPNMVKDCPHDQPASVPAVGQCDEEPHLSTRAV